MALLNQIQLHFINSLLAKPVSLFRFKLTYFFSNNSSFNPIGLDYPIIGCERYHFVLKTTYVTCGRYLLSLNAS